MALPKSNDDHDGVSSGAEACVPDSTFLVRFCAAIVRGCGGGGGGTIGVLASGYVTGSTPMPCGAPCSPRSVSSTRGSPVDDDAVAESWACFAAALSAMCSGASRHSKGTLVCLGSLFALWSRHAGQSAH